MTHLNPLHSDDKFSRPQTDNLFLSPYLSLWFEKISPCFKLHFTRSFFFFKGSFLKLYLKILSFSRRVESSKHKFLLVKLPVMPDKINSLSKCLCWIMIYINLKNDLHKKHRIYSKASLVLCYLQAIYL